MKLKDLQHIQEILFDLGEFHDTHADGDISELKEQMDDQYNKAMDIINEEKYKILLKNAKAKEIRKLNK